MKTGMIEYITPCALYVYMSYGLPGSKDKTKAMLDFCSNHCKIEVCEILKEEVENGKSN